MCDADFRTAIRRERERDSAEDHEGTGDLLPAEIRAEPQPFGDRGERRGEAVREQHREPRADAPDRAEHRDVAKPEADEAARDEPRQRRPAEQRTPGGVSAEPEQRRADDHAREVCRCASHDFRGARRADRGAAPEQCGEDGGQHLRVRSKASACGKTQGARAGSGAAGCPMCRALCPLTSCAGLRLDRGTDTQCIHEPCGR